MTGPSIRPQVISVRLSSHGRPDVLQTMRKHPTRAMPKTAVKLTPTVWFMDKTGHAAGAQVFTMHLDWPYFLYAREWNAIGYIDPLVTVLGPRP